MHRVTRGHNPGDCKGRKSPKVLFIYFNNSQSLRACHLSKEHAGHNVDPGAETGETDGM